MAEEHGCQTPETHRCLNNCGFFGSPATMNLCSQCYMAYRLKQQQQAPNKATQSASTPLSSLPAVDSQSDSPVINFLELRPSTSESSGSVEQKPSRCFACGKRVRLTEFKCRCGTTFCGAHRYPEKHNCTYDFKKAGREEIAKANPLVVAQKLERI